MFLKKSRNELQKLLYLKLLIFSNNFHKISQCTCMKKEKAPIIFRKSHRALVKIKKPFLSKYKSNDN